LLTDGLEAEREQGITIDVAYRYFATPRRKFIIADAPGHEQYTRNMVTAAAGSDAADPGYACVVYPLCDADSIELLGGIFQRQLSGAARAATARPHAAWAIHVPRHTRLPPVAVGGTDDD